MLVVTLPRSVRSLALAAALMTPAGAAEGRCG
jgi:hypothetical protein